jgi:glycerol-1-phosphate dehydrogenase [NAD(P)+]
MTDRHRVRTINDLCNMRAPRTATHAVFATAPSMNGYTSVNAITEHGHKKLLAAHAPKGVFFDLSVPPSAGQIDPLRPRRQSCRATSQADWRCSSAVCKPIMNSCVLAADELVLSKMQRTGLCRGDGEPRSNPRAIRFGTAIIGNSQPASQGENLISHFIDMFEPEDRPLIYHGEQIAVTTLTVARLQRIMMESVPVLSPDTQKLDSFVARYA